MSFTGQLGTPNSQLGEIELGAGQSSGTPLEEGGTVGRGTAGTAPVGSWSLNTTGPSIQSINPPNGASGLDPFATVVTIVWTAPDGIDPWSLQVTLAGQPAVAGGAFYSGSYAGSIVVDQNTATITISTHPAFPATVTVATTATDLENDTQTSNTSFTTSSTVIQANANIQASSSVTATATVLHVAASSIAGAATVTPSAKVLHAAVASISGVSSITPTAKAIHKATTSLAGAAAVTATADVIHGGASVNIAGSAAVTDTATVQHAATTAVSASSSMSSSGTAQHSASTTVQGVASVNAFAGAHIHIPVSDTVTVSESLMAPSDHEAFASLPGAANVTGSMVAQRGAHAPLAGQGHVNAALHGTFHVGIAETVPLSEALHVHYHGEVGLPISIPISETVQAGSTSIISSSTQLTIGVPTNLRVNRVSDLPHYTVTPAPGSPAFPITLLSASPITSLLSHGSRARVVGPTTVQFTDGTFTTGNIGDYIFLSSPTNMVSYLRITGIVSSTEVTVDQQLVTIDPQNGTIPWSHTTPVTGMTLSTTKQTNGALYDITISGLMQSDGSPFSITDSFTATASQPQVTGVEMLDDGQVVVTFSDPMLDDSFLTSKAEYSITGPTTVRVESITNLNPTQVTLYTTGMGSGTYNLTVNASGTPHDIAGNPIDPLFNEAVFTGAIPLTTRSIFTDMGPIAKAPNIYQTGIHATVVNATTLSLADGNLSPSMIGLLVTISGGVKNGGTFLIKAVPTATTAIVTASFTYPDSTVMSWKVFDPLDGQIADDPSDVSVTINGVATPALDVVGLLGQIILATAPNDGDQVLVNYNWVQNPVIDLRRLNSKEFRFNSWNRDLGYIPDPSRHKYRYNNTLPVPSEYVLPTPIMSGTGAQVLSTTEFNLPGATLTNTDVDLTVRIGGVNGGDYVIASVIDATHLTVQPAVQIFPDPGSGTLSWVVFDPNNTDERAPLAQPLLRDMKYRAYERAYTALLNDPGTLLFNSPTNKIAFPPLSRPLVSTFVNYQATGLPQNDPVAPWTLHGTGTATIVNDELVVTSSSAGPPFPSGQPIFWTRPIDLTFQHVFASSWRLTINSDPTTEGVFTGVASGFSDGEKCCVVGFLDNGGVHMIGILKAGAGNDPSQLSAWIGGLDSGGNPTNAPVAFEWDTIHSYRLFQDQTGTISVFMDGGVIATLSVPEASLPFLSELNEPFNQLQGIFFGALSRLAISTSTWDFLRYEILPINPQQVAPSIFVSYEGTTPPEIASQPWTPLGAHGTETIPHPGLLILDSTSATDQATEVITGLIDGDFRGFDRIEPLLSAASSVALDVNIQLLTWTHGISPNSVMVAIDDSQYLIQLSFFPNQASPLFSYGGRSFPDQFEPYVWTKMGGQTPTLIGQFLRITDASTTDGLLYAIDDNPTPSAPNRVVAFSNDYILEFRVRAISHTSDPGGFAGVNAEVYDSLRDLGVMFRDVAGTLYVALHSEGIAVASFPFNWNDGNFHTYRMVKSTAGNLVSLFIDTVFIGSTPYSSFSAPFPATPIGVISFGSTTPQSSMSLSVADWAYCNAWRVTTPLHHYVGIWKGFDPNALTGYHLPVKTTGRNARVAGNGLEDLNANFIAAGVQPGDVLIVDVGPNKDVYYITSVQPTILTVEIQTNPPVLQASASLEGGATFSAAAGVQSSTGAIIAGDSSVMATAVRDTTLIGSSNLTANPVMHGHADIDMQGAASLTATAILNQVPISPSPFPVQPSQVDYRIPLDVDWTVPHRYRIVRDPGGGVALFVDTTVVPVIDLGYNNIDLPPSSVGLPQGIAGGLPSVVWGAFDPTNLSQSGWQYVRYGITRPVTESQIVPPHQVLNQRNIIQSYERHLSNLPHTLTDFWSESEGITPQTTDPTFLENPALVAYTQLNELTPLVPSTQDYQVRQPTPVLVPVVGFNNIQDLMNSQSFVMNESEQRIELIVPPDVLYSSLTVYESDTGTPNLIAPFNDESQPYSLGSIQYQQEVCLTYDAATLPEQDPTAITPWTFFADQPVNVIRNAAGGILTYGTTSSGAQTVYLNETPLPDAPSLTTQVTFRLKLVNDTSMGLGDTQVRFGLSAPGMTASLAFVTMPLGQRYVLIIDQNTNTVVGGIAFDFLDGNFHTYRLVRIPTATPPGPPMMPPPHYAPPAVPGVLQVFIDP